MHEPESTSRDVLLEAAARRIIRRFEERAREVACDQAPTGIQAIQQRYYPLGGRAAPDDKELARLRRGLQQILPGP
jgi:hypothetical protein